MKNAHTRMAKLRYVDTVGDTRSNVEVFCERVVADEGQTHLLSFFGSDAATSAMIGALYDQRNLDLFLPTGEERRVQMGEHLLVMTSNISVPGIRHPLRHKLVLSEPFKSNGSNGFTYLLNHEDPVLSWGLVSDKLGLPSIPEWSTHMMIRLERTDRIDPLFGFNCSPVRVRGTREEFLEWIGSAVCEGFLQFPEKNVPMIWPEFNVLDAVYGNSRLDQTNSRLIAISNTSEKDEGFKETGVAEEAAAA